MEIVDLISVVIAGLVLGSFATALSYRLPRDLPIAGLRRSQCPSCQKTLSVPDLVPLFSWLFLRGKCRHCRAPISAQYPLIELATVGLCLAFYRVYGVEADTALIYLLAPLLVSIIAIDLTDKIIPDSLTFWVVVMGVALLLIQAIRAENLLLFLMEKGVSAAAGVFIYGVGSWVVRWVGSKIMKREALGLGDVKFYAASGFWLGLDVDAACVFLLVSGFSGVLLAFLWKQRTGDAEIPFGPSLVIGLIATLCFSAPPFIK